MKKRIFYLIIMIMLLLPIGVLAESKVSFSSDNITVSQGGSKKVDIVVEGDESFNELSFDLITTTYDLRFESVEFIDEANAKSSGSNYKLTFENGFKKGVIGTVTIGTKKTVSLGLKGNIRLNKVFMDNTTLDSAQLAVSVKNEESNNAYLSSITSEIVSIDFDKDTFKYTVEIADDVKELDLKALAEDSGANVDISSQKLDKTSNTITIKVTAEDGTEKNYVVIANKKKNIEGNNKEAIKDKTTTKIKTTKEDSKVDKSNWATLALILLVALFVDMVLIKKKK